MTVERIELLDAIGFTLSVMNQNILVDKFENIATNIVTDGNIQINNEHNNLFT